MVRPVHKLTSTFSLFACLVWLLLFSLTVLSPLQEVLSTETITTTTHTSEKSLSLPYNGRVQLQCQLGIYFDCSSHPLRLLSILC